MSMSTKDIEKNYAIQENSSTTIHPVSDLRSSVVDDNLGAPKARACISCRARKIRCDLRTHGLPCSACDKSSLSCREILPKRRRIQVAESMLANSQIETGSSTSSVCNTLGDGDNEPRWVHIEGRQDISQADSILLDFLSQDFGEASVGDYQATFIDNYANVVRILGTTFGRGFSSNVCHFRDAPFIKRLNGSIPRAITEEERVLLDNTGAFIIPDSRISNGFITAFFDRVHPTMPIVDQAGFRKSYSELSSINGSGPPLLLIQAILLSGSTVWQHPDLKPPAEEVSKKLFARAQALVYHRFEQDRFTLLVAHLLFSTFTCDSCDDTIQNMWLSLGTSVRIAQGLGLHRDLGAAMADRRHRRQWKRAWWTLFLHDTLCAFEWGRPRAINLEDSDVDDISEADFDPVEPGALPCTEHVDFFISMNQLCFVIGDWIDLTRPRGPRNHGRTRMREDDISHVRDELKRWFENLRPSMTTRGIQTRHSLWTGMLHITYHAAVIRCYSVAPVDSETIHQSTTAITTICLNLFSQGLLGSVWVYAIHQLYLAMCYHAQESRDADERTSLRGLENLCSSLPMLEQLGQKNSVARQAFVFLDKVAKGDISDAGIVGLWQSSSKSMWQSPFTLGVGVNLGGDIWQDFTCWDDLSVLNVPNA